MTDIENSRKTAEKDAEWVPGEVPVKQPKNSREKLPKQSKQLFFGYFGCFSGCFSAFYWHSTRDPLGTVFGCFSAVFNVGHSHLSSWPQRLQALGSGMVSGFRVYIFGRFS